MINHQGLDVEENWEKCEHSITMLGRRPPPYGVSLFAKVHFIQIYYLCMFNYLIGMITPPEALVTRAYATMIRFLWYPSKAHVITRDVLMLPSPSGGIGFPDIDIRVKVNRMTVLTRVLSAKEELSWRRAFFHHYYKVDRLSKEQLKRVRGVPKFYIEIREAELDCGFRRDGVFGWFFGRKFLLDTVKPKLLYDTWIVDKYSSKMVDRNIFWSRHLGVSENFVKMSWNWVKCPLVDGKARNIHYRLRHRGLYTNHRVFKFGPNISKYCTLCLQEGNVVKEDNLHLVIFCPRAVNVYYMVEPRLCEIANVRYLRLEDLVLGRRMGDKRRQNCFNFLIQHCQLAIWESRNFLEHENLEIAVEDVFRKNVFINLWRIKTVMNSKKFFNTFGLIVREAPFSIPGFQLRV